MCCLASGAFRGCQLGRKGGRPRKAMSPKWDKHHSGQPVDRWDIHTRRGNGPEHGIQGYVNEHLSSLAVRCLLLLRGEPLTIN